MSLAVEIVCHTCCTLLSRQCRGPSSVAVCFVFGCLLAPYRTDVWLNQKWYQSQSSDAVWSPFAAPAESTLQAGGLGERLFFHSARWTPLESKSKSRRLLHEVFRWFSDYVFFRTTIFIQNVLSGCILPLSVPKISVLFGMNLSSFTIWFQ